MFQPFRMLFRTAPYNFHDVSGQHGGCFRADFQSFRIVSGRHFRTFQDGSLLVSTATSPRGALAMLVSVVSVISRFSRFRFLPSKINVSANSAVQDKRLDSRISIYTPKRWQSMAVNDSVEWQCLHPGLASQRDPAAPEGPSPRTVGEAIRS